jgi:hypothetical protein
MWLGTKRGYLTDWTTQMWVKSTGKRVSLDDHPWLHGPIGKPTGIGSDFFHELANEQNLTVERGRGLLEDFNQLKSERCSPVQVDSVVKDFYENTECYELEAWSEWSGFFKPFGWALARLFSRRLQQLNVPLSSLDTSQGMTSSVLNLVDPVTGKVRYTAWARQLRKSKNTLYAGTYSLCTLPGVSGACVKVVFPLPNGNATVVMYPESSPDGSFCITSSGLHFGEPGFYFTVSTDKGLWARYVRAMRESIKVYASDSATVRADHVLWIWGLTFLRLHYKLNRVRVGDHVQGRPFAASETRSPLPQDPLLNS